MCAWKSMAMFYIKILYNKFAVYGTLAHQWTRTQATKKREKCSKLKPQLLQGIFLLYMDVIDVYVAYAWTDNKSQKRNNIKQILWSSKNNWNTKRVRTICASYRLAGFCDVFTKRLEIMMHFIEHTLLSFTIFQTFVKCFHVLVVVVVVFEQNCACMYVCIFYSNRNRKTDGMFAQSIVKYLKFISINRISIQDEYRC